MIRTVRLTAAFATAFATTFFYTAAIAYADPPDADYLWENPNDSRVFSENVAFSSTEYRHAKNESIFLMGYFNDGWVMMFNIFHIDTVLLDRWGMYALVGRPDGTTYWNTNTPKGKHVVFDERYLRYFDGENLLEDSGGKVSLTCNFDGFSCNLVFDKHLPPWKPGTGRENYTEDGEFFQYKAVFAPWTGLRGTIVVGGRTIDVEGFGYGEKTLFVNPLTKFQPYLHSLRVYTPYETPREERWHIGILHATLNKAYGYRELPRLVVAKGDKWLFTTRDYTFRPIRTSRVEDAPYDYGTAFELVAQKNGYTLNGILEERAFVHFTDIFENLPLWVKNILDVFFKRPVYFRAISDFTGSITDPDGLVTALKMSGPYEYVVVH